MRVNDIRNHLAEYIAGRAEYHVFREQIVGIYSELASEGESVALNLCRAIEGEVANFSEDWISEAELKKRLADLWNGRRSENTQAAVASYVECASSVGASSFAPPPSGNTYPVEQREPSSSNRPSILEFELVAS